jgi:hypothetical protein
MEQDKGFKPQDTPKSKSLGQRWADLQPSKTMLFWSCLATAVITMILGFTWGGWVTGGAAQSMSKTMSEGAVVTRLAPICVVQFLLDPAKAEKFAELKALSSWARSDYIMKQGWATITGADKPERTVAEACAKLVLELPESTLASVAAPVPTPAAETTPTPAK